ncbi:transcription factor WhiB [Nocardiopsis sp. Huas11]|uniref:WhiB family transcriptional regulator n=1 Tax=Nocardiopsis sp. Huas11 TaxID=2183912 RepID=UPI000EB06851|nr:WhiB family transcriptional regulator [Nocardiopsis sp. Huas11]RKS07055.1 transcription factor WhiB [Nocardiopsis sp. Huas11]
MGGADRKAPRGTRAPAGPGTAPTPGRPTRGQDAVSGADGPSDGPTRPSAGYGDGWPEHAACQGRDPALWFPDQGGSVRAAKQVCRRCPVQINCLADAMRRGERFGVWGGSSEDERRLFRTIRKTTRKSGRRITQPFAGPFANVEVADGTGRAA